MPPIPSTGRTWLPLAATVASLPSVSKQGFVQRAESDDVQRQAGFGEPLPSRVAYTAVSLLCMAILGGLVGANGGPLLATCTDVTRLSSTTSRAQKAEKPMFRSPAHLPPLHTIDVFRLFCCSGTERFRVVFTWHLSRRGLSVLWVLHCKQGSCVSHFS